MSLAYLLVGFLVGRAYSEGLRYARNVSQAKPRRLRED